ncbi:MAG: response regulator [Candidatus Peribacteraceae bacterium]|nr:response regulator [Candidatus Peribacteraceae bacterium]
MQKKKILIAEDDELLRHLYERKFTLAGYDIRTAANGEEALSAIEEDAPDILVLDINMPSLDGFQVLEKLPIEKRPCPVIMLSNFGDEKNKDRAKSLKVDGFFEKQYTTIKELLAMIEKVLKKAEGK